MPAEVLESPFAVSVDGLWACTELGVQQFTRKLTEMRSAMGAFMGGSREAPPKSSLLSIVGDVGVVQIKGPISGQASMFDSMFGMTSYPAIRSALVEAATSPDVKSILLDINSPGGQVTGVADTAGLIKQVDTIKPVLAHTSGDMNSAAYWLGSQARSISASQTSQVGSIGTIYTHVEESKALEKDGITVTVLREGDYKALASPYEPLTDKARNDIQGRMKESTDVFVKAVADGRGKTVPVVDATMGQGRVFVGQTAKDVGLVDHIQSFDQAVASASRLGATDTKGSRATNIKSETRMTAEQKAALAALGASEKTPEQIAAEAAAAELQATTEAAAVTAAAEAATVEAARVAAEAAAVDPVALNAQITSLTSALAAKDAQLLAVAVEKKLAEDRAVAAETALAPVTAIVEASLHQMTVALGGTPVITKQTPEALVTAHKATEVSFKKNFVIGGVAAIASPEDAAKSTGKPGANHRARINAARPSK